MKLNPVFVTASVSNIMDIVRELRSKNLIQGTDFNFAYSPNGYDAFQYLVKRSGATFYFKDPKWSTFFKIKYSKPID